MDHSKYMGKALALAQSALENGEFPVGCVLVYQGQIIATGTRTGTSGPTLRPQNEIDHAEMVALRHFYRITGLIEMDSIKTGLIETDSVKTGPIKPDPINPGKVYIYCTMEPCLMCFAAILLSGIGTVIYAYEDAMGGGTQLNLQHLAPLYRKNRITIIPHIRRLESLSLFKTFFNNEHNTYWKDSYLSRYTLSQK